MSGRRTSSGWFLPTLLAAAGSVVGYIVTIPFVLLTFPLWVVKGLTAGARWVVRRLQPDVTTWDELIEYEPVVGWKPRAALDVHARAGGQFHVTTDDEGWRDRRLTLDEADVAIFGDSFAFGQGADDEDLFTRLVSDLRVKPVGANGYSMVQGVLWMERMEERLEGKVLVWLIYYGNDLLENLRPNLRNYRMPFVRETRDDDGWEIVTGHVSEEPWPFHSPRHYTERLAEICSPSALSRRAFEASRYLVERASSVCEDAGADLVVVGVPDVDVVRPADRRRVEAMAPDPGEFDASLPDRKLGQICERLNLPFVALGEHLTSKDHLPDDCHWSTTGHRKVARVLGDVCRRVHAAREANQSPTAQASKATAPGTGR